MANISRGGSERGSALGKEDVRSPVGAQQKRLCRWLIGLITREDTRRYWLSLAVIRADAHGNRAQAEGIEFGAYKAAAGEGRGDIGDTGEGGDEAEVRERARENEGEVVDGL